MVKNPNKGVSDNIPYGKVRYIYPFSAKKNKNNTYVSGGIYNLKSPPNNYFIYS